MKVLMVSVEVSPFAWTGGLGDVVATLAKALRRLGVDARIMMPKHRVAAQRATSLERVVDTCYVHMPWWVTGCAVDRTVIPDSDVPVYMVEHGAYFDRDGIFGAGGYDYPDNLERFVFFCRAAIASMDGLQWRPDVVHVNDWHTSLLALYQKSWDLDFRTVYTAHQLAPTFHGLFPTFLQSMAGIDLGRPETRQFVRDGMIDLARAGLALSDMSNTVSERYAWEVAQPWAEEDVQDLVAERGDRFRGILNGIDYDVWNPAKDAVIVANYSPADMSGKAECKKHLQRQAGLALDPDKPLIGMVSRLDALKGFDLVLPALNDLRDAQFVFLGTGDPKYAAALSSASAREDIGLFLEFNSDLARHVYAGADMLLMPSRREPSGTSQMIALKFGTIPIVHMTGGLADTISEEPADQNGFVFQSYNVDDMVAAIDRACAAYRDPVAWSALVARAMHCDFSWDRSAMKYVQMYEDALAL